MAHLTSNIDLLKMKTSEKKKQKVFFSNFLIYLLIILVMIFSGIYFYLSKKTESRRKEKIKRVFHRIKKNNKVEKIQKKGQEISKLKEDLKHLKELCLKECEEAEHLFMEASKLLKKRKHEAVKKFKKSIEKFESILKHKEYRKHIDLGSIFVSLGLAYKVIGKPDKTVYYLKKATQIDNVKKSASYSLGIFYFELKKFEEALINLKTALSINSGRAKDKHMDFKASFLIGSIYFDMKKFRLANEFFSKALSINPRDKELREKYLLTLLNLKLYSEAERESKQLVEKYPQSFEFLNIYGNILFHKRRFKKALEFYEKALNIKKDNPIVFYNIGRVEEALGNKVKAIRMYKKALELSPFFQEAEDAKSRVAKLLSQ